MEAAGGRKFIISIVLVVIATFALFTGKADFTGWATFSGAILGLYGTGNVWTKHVESKNGTI